MNVTSIKAVAPAHQSETETAWHIFAALSHFRRDNKEARDNPDFAKAMNVAHDRWAELFAAAR